jgi:hypothetical protein
MNLIENAQKAASQLNDVIAVDANNASADRFKNLRI